jgi:predicted AlkP superfamily phosphohydrolase/phosphomutase
MAAMLTGGCSDNPRRLLIIGLDAANWQSMDEIVAAGDLPNLTRLIKGGVTGSLATFVPTASPAIWTTIATGQPPDKHGISFRLLRLDEGGEHEMLAALSSDERTAPALWNRFTDSGIRSAFVAWWATWPAEPIDGFMVSDKVYDAQAGRRTFPEDLRGELEHAGVFDGALPPEQDAMIREVEAQFKAWRRRVEEGVVQWHGVAPDVNDYLDDLAERIRVYRRIMTMDYATERMTHYLLDRDPSLRVVAPYFWYLDVCQHLLWKYWRPADFTVDPEEQRIFAPLVPEYYRFMDGVVGRLCKHVHAADVVIVSDHGMESSTSERCINDLFDVEGLLQDMNWLVRQADGAPDLARSRAYVHAESRQLRLINLSTAGRDSPGAVPEPEAEKGIAALAGELAALRTIPTGVPVFRDVRVLADGERSYRAGEFVVYVFAQADLAVAINMHAPLTDTLEVGGRRFPLSRWNRWNPGASGQHTEGPPGIVILNGRPFKRGMRITGARVHDIAPTVLAALGLPVAEDLEGKMLEDAFSADFLREHPPVMVPSYGVRPRPARAGEDSGTGDSAVLDQLRALGYIR